MECNKEDARLAKDIAEKNMQKKDFTTARKFVLKAQRLYPGIENISKLLCVCDVHCSAAEDKMFGNEKDWYGILQVEQTADDTLIKRQYRKFALLLHPDKNQFSGAEAAFKLIGEAQRILLDKDRRSIHDMKRRTFYKLSIPHQQQQPQPSSRNAGLDKQSMAQDNYSSNPSSHFSASNFPNQEKMKQAQPPHGKETFWTFCLHCSVRYQYYKDVLGKSLRCQSCKNSFTAYDLHDTGSAATQPLFPQKDVPCAPTSNSGSEAKNVKPKFNGGFQGAQRKEVSRSQKGPNNADRQRDEGCKFQKANGQRRKNVESSVSSVSDSSLDLKEVGMHEAADCRRSDVLNGNGDCQTRRSNRSKRHVSYFENANKDDQGATPLKKAKEYSSTEEKVDASNIFDSAFGVNGSNEECNIDGKNETLSRSNNRSVETHDKLDSSLDSSSESTPPKYVEYPDPEFSDFDKSREEHRFKVGQVWAAYDTVDAMPRFYAKIKKMYASGFKLQITWLEPDPDDDAGIEWTNSDLPYPCGKFSTGDTDITEDRLMFSHVVCGCKSVARSSFTIYPSMGETWAIFKNWDTKWCSIPENERKFEYEFVEVLSHYDKIVGIRVAPLGKLKGFASLFYRKNANEIQIPPSELLRFSHLVPSYRTTGNERIDVPKGSIELDPAATTMNLEEINLPWPEVKNHVDEISSNVAEETVAVNGAGNSAAAYSDKKGNKMKQWNGV